MEPTTPAPTDLFAELRHLHAARGDAVVLHDVTLTLPSREHAVILGPNGCGKSTLLKILTCECYPLARPGTRLRIFGRERWAVEDLRRRLGVVSSDHPGPHALRTPGADAVVAAFFSSATLWPHLAPTPQMRLSAAQALDRLDAAHLAPKPLGEMSAGELRRIQIARALVHSPQVLLLDEPSNALDLGAQHELREILRRLSHQGTGLLLVTHHLPDILPEIDRVIMMRAGRIVADGSKRDLLTSARLTALFGRPVEVVERQGYYHALA